MRFCTAFLACTAAACSPTVDEPDPWDDWELENDAGFHHAIVMSVVIRRSGEIDWNGSVEKNGEAISAQKLAQNLSKMRDLVPAPVVAVLHEKEAPRDVVNTVRALVDREYCSHDLDRLCGTSFIEDWSEEPPEPVQPVSGRGKQL